MTKVTEKYYCDVCGKETCRKPAGYINIDNGSTFSSHKSIHHNEVCTECCNKIIIFMGKMKEEVKE